MKLLLLGLLPLILLSLVRMHQPIIYFAIGVPVLLLWVVSAIVPMKPEGLSGDQ